MKPRHVRRSALAIGVVAILFGAAIAAYVAISSQSGSVSPSLTRSDRQIAEAALHHFTYRDGEWTPSEYSSPDWAKYQVPAAASAALGAMPGGTGAERQIAVATVNTAISHHQLPSGDFDNGTVAAGPSSVWGGFWAETEGLIAWTLRHSVPASTLTLWERSMVRYVQFLQASHDSTWYANGNVVLRQALVMLETYHLAQAVGDPNAARYWRDYLGERQFLVDPSSTDHTHGPAAWRTYGEYTDGARLWFDESPSSAPRTPITCANGASPCQGFDPNYTTAQLDDATIAYTVGGDDAFWGHVVKGEYAAIASRIRNGVVNAAHGSRDDIPSEVFYPPVYRVLSELGAGDNAAWSLQLNAMRTQLRAYEKEANPGPNASSLLIALAVPLI